MDTTPIYELRERLRAAAMAGTSLLAEDFRLRRACEMFKPLAAASPVFAKIGQLTEQLLSPDISHPQGALLDAVSLTDAVICTLGAVDVAGEILLGTAGLFMGMFVGCLALAIAEMLDSIPIFARRVSYRHGLGLAVLAVAIGKLLGSLYYFWQGEIFPG